MKEVLEKCRYCNAPLKLKISETSIHTFQGHRNEFTIKHEPSLACTKCNNMFQAESYQSEKTNAFLHFLMSSKLKKAEIEYKDMIRYVDKNLKFNGDKFLMDDQTVKTVIFPDTIKYIGEEVLKKSSVENITLPDGLEHLGSSFAAMCPNFKTIKYTGTNIKWGEMGHYILDGSNIISLRNEKGAYCLGNWLLFYYNNDIDNHELKIADLGDNGIKIENIGNNAINRNVYIYSLDLEGVKYIDSTNFNGFKNVNTIKNEDSIEKIDDFNFYETPWYESLEDKNCLRFGKSLIYYKTDSTIVDLTCEKLAGIKSVGDYGMRDSHNIDTLKCNSDCVFGNSCFYKDEKYENNEYVGDPLPANPMHTIKKVYVDGKELTYPLLLEDPAIHAWLKKNIKELNASAFLNTMVEAKTKDLFKQLDITYYGVNNDKVGTLTPTEEFYIRLKIHDYLSQFPYDHDNVYRGMVGAFLLGGKLDCRTYAQLAQYLQECAGLESKSLQWDPDDPDINEQHYRNSTRIGDEWFESDDGWDAQGSHDYRDFALSSSKINKLSCHNYMYAYDSFRSPEDKTARTERVEAKRTLGDIDGDGERDQTDVDLLWAYVKDESDSIPSKPSDINFDTVTDVTDALLLDQFVNGKALDVDNVPIDGMSPGFKVYFVDDDNYNDIHSAYTDRDGYITLPTDLFEAPKGKKLVYDIGRPGEKVKVH